MSQNHEQQKPINTNQTSCFITLKSIDNDNENFKLLFQATKTKPSTLNAVQKFLSEKLDCEINLEVDKNKELKQLLQNYNSNILDFFLTQKEKIIYYQKQNEENIILEEEQQSAIKICQDSSFMADKMQSKNYLALEKKTACTLSVIMQEQRQEEQEQDMMSLYSSVSSISTIFSIKCTNNNCNMEYDNNKLKKMLTSSIEEQQLAICDKCKKYISSKICLKLGMIGQLYADWKLQFEICKIQQEQMEKNKNNYLLCQNCDFFCRKQNRLEQNLKKLFCPNCLVFGSFKQ